MKSRFVWFLLAFFIVVVYLYGLDSIPLLGHDEPRYSQVAREMFERNDWVTPTLGNFNWFEKPALLYWLQITSYKFFGVSEFSARFGSAIFGLLTIFSLYLLGKTAGQVAEPDKAQDTKNNLANWLFLISASSIGLLVFSRGASFDIILTFPITASLVSFFIFERSDKKDFSTFYLPIILFYFFIGLALLAKGLVGFVFPLAIVFFYYLLIRKFPNRTFIFSLFWGTALSLLIASTWYVPMYLRHGWTFIDEFFIQHHFARYTSNKYQHPQPFYYFFWVLPLMMLPWLPFFIAAIWGFIKDIFSFKQSHQELRITNYELRVFSFAWLLVPLVFFSFSGSKLPGYILPALPAAVILMAEYISRFVRNNRMREVGLQILALIVFAGIVLSFQFSPKDFARHETVKNLISTADSQGYADARILHLHTISHNAEFYGAGRLVRTDQGKIRQFFGVPELAEEIRQGNKKTVLVLIPAEHVNQLLKSDLVTARILDENGRLIMLAVNLKESEISYTFGKEHGRARLETPLIEKLKSMNPLNNYRMI